MTPVITAEVVARGTVFCCDVSLFVRQPVARGQRLQRVQLYAVSS